jgi:hypothetical protein
MTCAEARELLTEHSLGLLHAEQAREVERHVQWCAGCREESAELAEGVASLALSIPPADPPSRLEEAVVDRVAASAGTRGRPRHRAGVRVLAAAALAAAMLAGGALQWGMTQRRQAQSLSSRVQQQIGRAKDLSSVVAELQDAFKGTGTLYQASLFPVSRREEGGTALMYSGAHGQGWILVDVVATLDERLGPFTVNLVSSTGRRLEVGTITRSEGEGDYVRYWPDLPNDFTRPDAVELSQVTVLEVIDRFGDPVVSGTVHPYIESPPSP